jgi:hypothetical protein
MLLDTAKADHNMQAHAVPIADAAGRQSKLSLWNHPGDDIYGAIARSRRIVDAMEQLLGGADDPEHVRHHQGPVNLRQARTGGDDE